MSVGTLVGTSAPCTAGTQVPYRVGAPVPFIVGTPVPYTSDTFNKKHKGADES